MTNFEFIKHRLNSLANTIYNEPDYSVPGKWINSSEQEVTFHPIDYFINRCNEIDRLASQSKPTTKDLHDCIIYSMMPRYTTAYEHFTPENRAKITATFCENGSILKTIAMLPYLKENGTDILFLLPISAIGTENRKGNAGSVYAVRNPKLFDAHLNEKFLNCPLQLQIAALTEAAHSIGIVVITEFIFRTASIDSDLISKNPEFFYWIKEECASSFRPPKFSEEEINTIKEKINSGDFSNLPAPSAEYKSQFTATPKHVKFEHGKFIGFLEDGSRCVVPGSFADWPPDDNQPVWNDVTYLKFFDNPEFNYIAYNTVRMYDTAITSNSVINPKLEKYINSIIPYYINTLNIDGAMLDMGHALPGGMTKRIISDCRKRKDNFIFFGENFVLDNKSANEGYNAVTGYLPFDLHKHNDANAFLWRIARNEISETSFATAETHNTKRTQAFVTDSRFSKMIWGIASFIPHTVRYINSGFELLEKRPVNTGLGFSDDEINSVSTNDLPLFSNCFMDWNHSLIEDIRQINSVRANLIQGSIKNYDLQVIEPFHPEIITFLLTNGKGSNIFIAANYSKDRQFAKVNLPSGFNIFYNSIKNVNLEVFNNTLNLDMDSFEIAIGMLKK